MANRLAELLSAEKLPVLDGFRAVAVLIVIAYHAGFALPARLGVSAFFVMSGFLITWLLLREIERTEKIDLGAFYIRRSLRIFPAYYAFLVVSLFADHMTGDARSLDAALPAAFYILNYYNAVHDHPSISIAHAWSLAIEEQFYLLWPVLLMLMRKWSIPAIAYTLLSFILAVVVWRSFVYYGTDLGNSWIYNAFDTRADNLAIGCLAAVTANLLVRSPSVNRILQQPLILVFCIAALGFLAYWPSEAWRYTVGFTVEAVLLALILLQAMCLSTNRVVGILEWRPLAYVGRLSYGMYLYHVLALAVASKLLRSFELEDRSVLLGVGLVVTLSLAAFSYHCYEAVFLRLRNHFRSSAPTRASQLPPSSATDTLIQNRGAS